MYRDIITINRQIYAVLGKLSKLLLELFMHPEIKSNPDIAKNISKKMSNAAKYVSDIMTAAVYKSS